MEAGPPFSKANWNVQANASHDARRMIPKTAIVGSLMYLYMYRVISPCLWKCGKGKLTYLQGALLDVTRIFFRFINRHGFLIILRLMLFWVHSNAKSRIFGQRHTVRRKGTDRRELRAKDKVEMPPIFLDLYFVYPREIIFLIVLYEMYINNPTDIGYKYIVRLHHRFRGVAPRLNMANHADNHLSADCRTLQSLANNCCRTTCSVVRIG